MPFLKQHWVRYLLPTPVRAVVLSNHKTQEKRGEGDRVGRNMEEGPCTHILWLKSSLLCD